MEHRYHEDIDLQHCGLFALYALHIGESIAAYCDKTQIFTAGSPELRALMTLVLEQERQLAPIAENPDDDFRFLFDARTSSCPYFEAMLTQPAPGDDEAAQRRAVAMVLSDINEEEFDFTDDKSFYQWIHAQPVDNGTKSDLIQLYGNYARYRAVTDALNRRTAPVLSAFLPDFLPHIRNTLDHVRGQVVQNGSLLMPKLLDVRVEPGEVYDVYISTTQPNAMSIFSYDHGATCLLYIGVGVFALIEHIEHTRTSEEGLMRFLKTLADPTKFQILKYLRDERKYSTQISEQMGLSAATISHHMSQLGSQELVQFVKEGTRIYYRLNSDQVREKLRELSDLFLNN